MGEPTSLLIPAADGLKLHVRSYAENAPGAPVVCLPGLTRTAADFEALATALAAAGRRVLALDCRGRGLSDYDANAANYNVAVELADAVTVLTALEAEPAVIVGTSRGGILAMLLAATRPGAVAAAVLNDIGPVIEREGLLRIKSYVGKMPQPRDEADAAHILRSLFAEQFPRLSDAEWQASARRAFKEERGRLVPTYDVRLAQTLAAIEPGQDVPAMWEQFDALAGVPVMIVRGALSDLLSAETVAAMRARRARPTELIEIAEQGHAPLLNDPATIARIAAFIARAA